ncbi:MAG: P-II family nitrogen regulator [Bacteroidota bacterium]
MKLITAIIRETRLDQVREALIEAEIERITVTRVSGHGQQVREEIYRGRKVIPNLIPKIRLEIGVNDEFVDITINTILKAAKSGPNGEGAIGDGKIFITPMEDCIRIRTGERGGSAI